MPAPHRRALEVLLERDDHPERNEDALKNSEFRVCVGGSGARDMINFAF